MNKSFKKVLSLLMTLAMILTALPLAGVTAFAEAYAGDPNEHTSGDFRYIIWANNTVGISGYTGSAEKLNIPSKLDTYTVTSIEYGAFEGCDNLISVSIPNSITSIGNSTFRNCESLTNITIPESVISIGDEAFLNTGYYNNPANWQNGVLYIDNCLIEAKSNEIPQNYKINEGTRVIADSAFEDCDSLTSITIPDSVTYILNQAFNRCSRLTNITIPNSVTSIGLYAFRNCKSLTEIKVDANNKNYSSQDGVLFNKNKTELIQYPIGSTRTSYDIPNSVISIGDWAFEDCESLTSVSIPESVTNIEGSAFYGTGYYNNPSNWENGALYIDNCLIEAKSDEIPENYTINEGTRVIAGGAFFICENLTSITIPDSVICVGYGAFNRCYSLTSVTIGKGVTSIGDEAFIDCYNLKEIKVDANNKYYSSQDGVLFDNNKAELIQYPAGNTRTSYNIPNGVKSIG